MAQKKWLYLLVVTVCFAGYMWLGWNEVHYVPQGAGSRLNMCLFKRITGLPCPSCGSTRAILHISRFEFKKALLANPIGFFVAFAMLIFPLWVGYDVLKRKSTFFTFYSNFESIIKRRWITACLVFLVAANWLWNIYKYNS